MKVLPEGAHFQGPYDQDLVHNQDNIRELAGKKKKKELHTKR